jgi:hypothetical protein
LVAFSCPQNNANPLQSIPGQGAVKKACFVLDR